MVGNNNSGLHRTTAIVGTSVSGTFLYLIALLNLIVMIGIVNNKMHYTPLEKAVKAKQKISDDWLKIVKILAS